MTITNTPLYRALAKGVRKEDHAELARMLGMVRQGRWGGGFTSTKLRRAFLWRETPQGGNYWSALSYALLEAGYESW